MFSTMPFTTLMRALTSWSALEMFNCGVKHFFRELECVGFELEEKGEIFGWVLRADKPPRAEDVGDI